MKSETESNIGAFPSILIIIYLRYRNYEKANERLEKAIDLYKLAVRAVDLKTPVSDSDVNNTTIAIAPPVMAYNALGVIYDLEGNE